MSHKPSGGPAFARPDGSEGMTLRDYLAGQALAGMPLKDDGQRPSGASLDFMWAAAAAYKYADAMIAERAKS